MIWSGEYSREWVRHFALFPRHVEEGQKVVWLQHYWRKYIPGDRLCIRCQLSEPKFISAHWITSATEPKETE